jgi:hypothetical protein
MQQHNEEDHPETKHEAKNHAQFDGVHRRIQWRM